MKIAIFGAAGRTGRLLVDRALAEGHEVTAFARESAALPDATPKLRIVRGDAHDAAAVAKAVRGQDVVLSVLGAPRGRDVCSRATENIVSAMRESGVTRYVCLGTFLTLERPGLVVEWIVRPLLARDIVADKSREHDILTKSQLAWTLVCPPTLTNGPFRGSYRVDHDRVPSGGMRIARADVAHFMLEEASRNAHVGRVPSIAY